MKIRTGSFICIFTLSGFLAPFPGRAEPSGPRLSPGQLKVAVRERRPSEDGSAGLGKVKAVISLIARDETGETVTLRSIASQSSFPVEGRRRVKIENRRPPRRGHPSLLPPRPLARLRRSHRLTGLRIFIPDRELKLDFSPGFISARSRRVEETGLGVVVTLDPRNPSDPEVMIFGGGSGKAYPVRAVSARAERPFYHRSSEPHRVRLLPDGADALQARLDMISRARRSVDLEYYIFETGQDSSKMIVQALVEKAREGVRVRILRDYTPFGSRFDPWLAALLREEGIEVRIFNPAWHLNPWQFRAHRKLLIVDGNEAITGGRNIADSYFGLDRGKNFIDLDVWVEGEIVEVMGESFEEFWNSKYSRPVLAPRRPRRSDYVDSTPGRYHSDRRRWARRLAAARRRFLDPQPVAESRRWIEKTAAVQSARSRTREVDGIVFCSDRPENPRFHRVVSGAIFDRMLRSPGPLKIMAPYFIPLRKGEQVVSRLLKEEIPVKVLGNSRFSYDDIISIGYVIESSARRLVAEGLVFYGYSGQPPPGEKLPRDDYRRRVNWEFHSKAGVLGPDSVMIGSYNFNPRSKIFNSETVLFIESSPELARDLGDIFNRMVSAAFLLDSRGDYDCDNFRGLSRWRRLRRYGLFDAAKYIFTNTLALFARDMM